jgi:hypothetical protein
LEQLQQFAGPAAASMAMSGLMPGAFTHTGAAAASTPGFSHVYVVPPGGSAEAATTAAQADTAAASAAGAGEPNAAGAPAAVAPAAQEGVAAAAARHVVFVLDVRLIIKLLFMVYVLGHNGSQDRLICLGVFSVFFYLYRIGCFARLGLRGGLDDEDEDNEDAEFRAAVNANAHANGAPPARPARRQRPVGFVGRVTNRVNVNNFGRIPSQAQENRFLTDAKCLIASFVLSTVPSWEVQRVPEPAQLSSEDTHGVTAAEGARSPAAVAGDAGEDRAAAGDGGGGNGAAAARREPAGPQAMAIAAAGGAAAAAQ